MMIPHEARKQLRIGAACLRSHHYHILYSMVEVGMLDEGVEEMLPEPFKITFRQVYRVRTIN
jgi:hypothetical protein